MNLTHSRQLLAFRRRYWPFGKPWAIAGGVAGAVFLFVRIIEGVMP